MRTTPLRNVRSRLLAIVLVALALSLTAATLIFNVLFARTTQRDADALVRTRAASELSFVAEHDQRTQAPAESNGG